MIDKLVGNTPLIKIKYKYKESVRHVYAKLEYYNFTGSIKDRVALHILKESKRLGLLKDKQPIIEATSGNTGISFASIGTLLGHDVHIFMPEWASDERKRLLKLYGATVHLVSKEEGGFSASIKQADALAESISGFRPDQFNNKLNIEAHYLTTAKEILDKVDGINGFTSGIGTGGTLMGVAKRLKEYNKNIKVIALEPSTMPLLTSGKIIANHKIEGIGDDFIPSLVDRSLIDEVVLIDDIDAIKMSQKLSHELGLGVGISSGANFLSSVLSGIDNMVTVFADDNKKYLTTDLSKEIDTPSVVDDITLLGIEYI